MKRLAIMAAPLILSGCALPPVLTVASYLMDGVSLVSSGKSLGDHALSIATASDCSVLRIVRGKEMCHDFAPGETPYMVAEAERWARGGEIVGQGDIAVEPPVSVARADDGVAEISVEPDPVLIPEIAGLDLSIEPIARPAQAPTAISAAFAFLRHAAPRERSRAVETPSGQFASWSDPRSNVTVAATASPAAQIVPAPPEPAGAGRAVVVGSFIDRDNAVAEASHWAGSAPEIVPASVHGTTFYRVVLAARDGDAATPSTLSWRIAVCPPATAVAGSGPSGSGSGAVCVRL